MKRTPAVGRRSPNRLFIAAVPSTPLRDRLSQIATDSARDTGGRAVATDNLHLTLAFLGDVPLPAVEPLLDGLRGVLAAYDSVRVHLDRIEPRPSSTRARLIAVSFDDLDGAVSGLAASVREVAGLAPEDRPFWPHVTVARLSRPTPVRRFPPLESEHVFDFSRVGLYDSDMTQGGPPRYHEILGITLSTQSQRSSLNG